MDSQSSPHSGSREHGGQPTSGEIKNHHAESGPLAKFPKPVSVLGHWARLEAVAVIGQDAKCMSQKAEHCTTVEKSERLAMVRSRQHKITDQSRAVGWIRRDLLCNTQSAGSRWLSFLGFPSPPHATSKRPAQPEGKTSRRPPRMSMSGFWANNHKLFTSPFVFA